MSGKITLITPPDFFENSNPSILFVNLSAQEQDNITKWLVDQTLPTNINFYVYDGEPNAAWFLYALNRCEYKYINIDGLNEIALALCGYALGKFDVFYKTENENLAGVYSHINNNRVRQVEQFLESVIGAKTSEPQL